MLKSGGFGAHLEPDPPAVSSPGVCRLLNLNLTHSLSVPHEWVGCRIETCPTRCEFPTSLWAAQLVPDTLVVCSQGLSELIDQLEPNHSMFVPQEWVGCPTGT